MAKSKNKTAPKTVDIAKKQLDTLASGDTTQTTQIPEDFRETETAGVGDNSTEAQKVIVEALEVCEQVLKDLMPTIVEESSGIDVTMEFNANAVSLVLRPIVRHRLNFNAIVIADDKFDLDNGSFRQYVYTVCLGGNKPDSSSALYKTIERGVFMATLPIMHDEVTPSYKTEKLVGQDEKGKEVITFEIVTDEEGNPVEDGGIKAPRLYVHKKTKEQNEKSNWVMVDETRTDSVPVPLGKLSDVNKHYNPPAPRGTPSETPTETKDAIDAAQIAADLNKTKDGMTFKHVVDRINGSMSKGTPSLRTLSSNALFNIIDLLTAMKVFKSEALVNHTNTLDYLETLVGQAIDREHDEDVSAVAETG